jgi:hypothetical protein
VANFDQILALRNSSVEAAKKALADHGNPAQSFIVEENGIEDRLLRFWRNLKTDPAKDERLRESVERMAQQLASAGDGAEVAMKDFKVKLQSFDRQLAFSGDGPSNPLVESTLNCPPWPKAPDTQLTRMLRGHIRKRP